MLFNTIPIPESIYLLVEGFNSRAFCKTMKRVIKKRAHMTGLSAEYSKTNKLNTYLFVFTKKRLDYEINATLNMEVVADNYIIATRMLGYFSSVSVKLFPEGKKIGDEAFPELCSHKIFKSNNNIKNHDYLSSGFTKTKDLKSNMSRYERRFDFFNTIDVSPTIIYGTAGSGKTRCIRQTVFDILDQNPYDNILILTPKNNLSEYEDFVPQRLNYRVQLKELDNFFPLSAEDSKKIYDFYRGNGRLWIFIDDFETLYRDYPTHQSYAYRDVERIFSLSKQYNIQPVITTSCLSQNPKMNTIIACCKRQVFLSVWQHQIDMILQKPSNHSKANIYLNGGKYDLEIIY